MRDAIRILLAACLTVTLCACEGPIGPAGAAGTTGDPGIPCTVTDNGDGTYDINCDGTVIRVTDGAPGGNCSVVDNLDGTKTITCTDGTTVTLTDGEDATGGEVIPWAGGVPISRRIHAIHNGANLNYPQETVSYNDHVAGREWEIHFTQDIRNCETCHPAGDSSGSFLTEPSRHPCRGCHDSDAAQAHYKVMTFDPTPNAPWNGDEEESCKACHLDSAVGVGLSDNHSTGYLLSTGEYEPCPTGSTSRCGKFFVNITFTSASVDAAGVATMDFHIADLDGNGVDTYDATLSGPPSDIQMSIISLEPPMAGRSFTRWIPYIVSTVTVPSAGPWPNPAGTAADIGSSEDIADFPANFLNLGGGDYRYTFDIDLSSAMANGSTLTFDRSRLHRVQVRTGGHEDATGEGFYDFVPDGGAATLTRDIVQTSVCLDCHGESEFHGHGGDRLTLEGCNTCHNSFYDSPYNDESLGMTVMTHKIHAGGQLPSIPGADGLVWDDPATTIDESADNGDYVIYRNRGGVREYRWPGVEFPGVIENCQKCHTRGGADEDNWKTVPSIHACGSCHDTTSFVSPPPTGMVLHTGGAAADDTTCAGCHPPSGSALAVEDSHDWTTHTPRNIPEFGVTLSVSTPTNGTHFVDGESPMVSIVLDKAGTPIDHMTVVEDDDGKEGCTTAESEADNCPAEDGKFTNAYLFVHGPRAKRNPVLTTASRAEIFAATAGPFDLSAGGVLGGAVDGGKTIRVDDLRPPAGFRAGTFEIDVADGTFTDAAAATAGEVVIWLNSDSVFAARAIAYIENGLLAVRSRNLGDFYSMQLLAGSVNTAIFGGVTGLNTIGGYYPNNVVYQHTDPTEDDPKVAWTTGAINYTLDTVDDLVPGTYIASVEIADRGRVGGTDYATPSVGWVTFQVKQAAVELPPAGNCDSCHQDDNGRGWVLDFARHNKLFTDDAIDQCGACHDLQNRD